MKKIPTLFKRIYSDHKAVGILNEVTPGCEPVLERITIPTIKRDGSACAIINGELYKRYDARKGKVPPTGAIPCQPEPDTITGHWPHWVKVSENNPADKWFIKAYENSNYDKCLSDTTYEAVGPHFQGNAEKLDEDILIKHGSEVLPIDLVNRHLTFEGLRTLLEDLPYEGIVFWYNGEPLCKIKRSDFGFAWPLKK